MSFQNANLQIQSNLLTRAKSDTRYKLIDALVDARRQNNTITETDLGANGKLRQFKMNYYPVVCDGEGSCDDSICDTGTVIAPKQLNFDVTQCTASKVYRLNIDDIRLVDGDMSFSDHAMAQIGSVLGGVRKALDQDMAAILVANVGCQPDGNPTKRLSLTDQTNGALRPLGLWTIEQTFEDAGMSSPFIIGGTDVFTWSKATQIGGLNASGQDTGRFNNAQMYYDPLVDAAFGDNTHGHVLAFDPQMLKFVTFSKNAGMFATNWTGLQDMDKQFKESKNGSIKGSFLDPVTGLIWDLNIRYVDCDEEHWTFKLRLLWDIFFLPDYVCNVDCVNGIYHFLTCLPVPVECSDVEPVPPATPTIYNWNPSFAYPLLMSSLTLAGQSNNPNVTVTTDAELAAALTNAISGYSFSVSGSNITYTGYSEIGGTLNGTINIDFEPATT